MSNCLDYINTEKKIILIWSPKVACTTLHKWFVEDISNIKLDVDPRITAANKNFIRKIENYNNFKDYNIYFFIRNPIFRCISCYINKFVKYYDGRSLNNLESLEGFSIDLIRNYNPELIKNYKGITFNEFLNAIEHGMKINNIDIHFDNQVNKAKFNNFNNKDKIKIKNIKNLGKELNKINKTYNIKEKKYEKNNKSSYSVNKSFVDITNIKSINLKDNQVNIKNFKNSFNRIKKIYESDFKYLKQYLD